MLRGESASLKISMNGSMYPRYYLLVDGIYPRWSCFMQMIHEPQDEKRSRFAMMQEATCKDVERAFGVLQSRFAIIQNPFRHWNMTVIDDIMVTCVILHNMIIEDESDICLETLFEPSNVPHRR
jgi:hypothetical protein